MESSYADFACRAARAADLAAAPEPSDVIPYVRPGTAGRLVHSRILANDLRRHEHQQLVLVVRMVRALE